MFKSGLLAQAACLPAVLLTVLALLAESLPLVLLAAAAAGWLTGPAMTALYDTILRALRDEPGFWWHTYRRVWRRSFRSSLLPGVAFTALWSCLLYARLAAAPAGPLLLSAACLTAFQTYYWMQEALFERPAARQQVSITTIKKLCDGLDITLGQFFTCSLFDRLGQEMQ